MSGKAVMTGTYFMNGDEACAEGALAAGCRFFGGYPITPATEVAERMALRLPEVDGIYIQMEDEMASMASILGASWGGKKAMTSTSGPGLSLMLENIGLGICTETPCVICNVQRGGPSTGLPTLVAQSDMMQARWGAHGHYEIIALVPSSPQEMFDFTIRAFNLSEEFRTPVLIMADEVIGHMNERVVIPEENKIKLVERKKPKVPPDKFFPYHPDPDWIAPMACFGDGYKVHITGLTHDERGYPGMDADTQAQMMERLVNKIRKRADEIADYIFFEIDDAEIIVVAYGITSRSAKKAIAEARKKNIKAGLVKLNTVWPFPEKMIRDLAGKVKGMIMPEINLGQVVLELERCVCGQCPVILVPHPGGSIIKPSAILKAIEEI